MKKIHSEKNKNTKTLFEMQDNSGIIISKTIEYNDPNDDTQFYKIIIIAKETMLNSLKNNQINQFFMDCTYKMVPPNKNKLNNYFKKISFFIFIFFF